MRWIVPLLLAVAPAQSAVAEASDRISYVLFDGSGDRTMMSGSSDDVRLAERYRAGSSPLLYVRDGAAAYVIRDPALLRRVQAIMEPQRQLGERQGALGRQQGELGSRQAALGAEQGRLGALMASSAPRQMNSLAERQAALGREQARLAALARPQFRALVNEAIQRGLAQRVD